MKYFGFYAALYYPNDLLREMGLKRISGEPTS